MGSDLQTLADRLEGLSGADRPTDVEIAQAFGWRLRDIATSHFWQAPEWWTPLETIEGLPFFTRSLDAAVALVERALKPLSLQVTILSNGSASAVLGTSASPFQFVALAPTAPLALLRALVAAKIEEASIPTKSGVE